MKMNTQHTLCWLVVLMVSFYSNIIYPVLPLSPSQHSPALHSTCLPTSMPHNWFFSKVALNLPVTEIVLDYQLSLRFINWDSHLIRRKLKVYHHHQYIRLNHATDWHFQRLIYRSKLKTSSPYRAVNTRHLGYSNNNNTGNVSNTWHRGTFVQLLLLWERNKYYIFWVSVCSLRHPACNAHAPNCHLWSVRLYSIFPHYLINGTIFGKKLLNTKCVFWFSV